MNSDPSAGAGPEALSAYLQALIDEEQDGDLFCDVLATPEDLSQFCTPTNIDSSSRYVNESLAAYGFPSGLRFASTDVNDTANVLNCLYAMLRQRQRDVEFRESTMEEFQRVQSDKDALKSNQGRLLDKIESLQREIARVEGEKTKLEDQMKKMRAKWGHEKEELSLRLMKIQQRDTQYQHEIRKKERDYTKLQQRIQSMSTKQNKDAKAGMELLNSLQEKKRGQWQRDGKKTEEEFYRSVVSAYQEKENQLLSENQDLRKSLRCLQQELKDVLEVRAVSQILFTDGKMPEAEVEAEAKVLGEEEQDVRPAQFDLPFDMIRGNIEESLRRKLRLLKVNIAKMNDLSETAHAQRNNDELLVSLQHQLVECKKIIAEQEKLIQYSLYKRNSLELPCDLNESRNEALRDELEEERSLLEEQRRNMAAERETITQAAIEIDQERMQVQREKRDLEELRLGLQALTNDAMGTNP